MVESKRTFVIVSASVLLITSVGWSKTIHVPGDSSTIKAGINGAVDGDTVLVVDGVYTGEGNKNLDFLGKAIVVRAENGPNSTIIDCENEGRGFYIHNGEGPDSRVEGFTITKGLASEGAGICCWYSAPTISNCVISGNEALGRPFPWNGGNAEAFGGGIFCNAATIINCAILNNSAIALGYWYGFAGGGGISSYGSAMITNCTISGNYAYAEGIGGGAWGGGIECGDDATITNCIISGNGNEGIVCDRAWASITNCIIAGNDDSGILCVDDSSSITNCILWGNSGSEILEYRAKLTITYSDVDGGWPGEGNIDEDPLFRDPENDDFHLMATYCGDPYDSPCIDAGDPSILDDILDCRHGLGTSRSDMGAYGGSNAGWPTAVEEDEESEVSPIPENFSLCQNYPNPFNASTEIRYQIPEDFHVILNIFNSLGQQVRSLKDAHQHGGEYTVNWDGRDEMAAEVASGLYFCRLEGGDFCKTIKMVLIK
jgi:hypothetical protein